MTVPAPRRAFEIAIHRWRLEGPNPCSGVKTGPSNACARARGGRELKALLEWLPGAKRSVSVRDARRCLLLTGTRSGEVPTPAVLTCAGRLRVDRPDVMPIDPAGRMIDAEPPPPAPGRSGDVERETSTK
jgi:hypothetical protein